MAEQVSSLIVRLIDQVTGPAKGIAKSLLGIGRAAKGAGATTFADRIDAAMARNNARIAQYRGKMVDAVATLYTLGHAIKAPIEASRKFEAAFADVKKVVEFPTEGPYSATAFRKTLLDLSRRVPLTVEELTQIAAAGGQAGVALDELAGFTESVAQVSTAFEISTEEAGKALANLKGALKLNNPQVMLLADHMNVLANNMATSERQVLDVVNRVGALGSVVGVNAKSVAALGAAMTSAGSDAESAGTAIRNMFLNLAQGSGMTKDQAGVMKKLGLDPKTFPKKMQTEGIGAIVDLLERVAKLPTEKRAAALTDLFDKRAVDAIGPMLNNLDLLRQALGLVADDTANAGASQREYNKRTDTFDAKMKTFGNTLNALNIAIGDALVPALTLVLEKITPVVNAIGAWAEKNPKLAAGIIGVVGGLLAFNAAMTIFKYASALGYGGILTLVKGIGTLSGAFATLSGAIAATGIGAILILIALAGLWIYNNWKGISAMFDAFGRSFKAALGPEATAALSTVIGWVSKLWDWITKLTGPMDMTEAQWRRIGYVAGQALGDAVNWVMNLKDNLTQLWDSGASKVEEWKGKVRAATEAVGPFMRGMVDNVRIAMENGLNTALSKLEEWKNRAIAVVSSTATEWYNAGSQMVQALWDGMVALFDQVIAWVKNKAAELLAPFTGLAGKIKSALSFGGGGAAPASGGLTAAPGDGAALANSVDGARAAGGPVTKGRSYLVGERRAEIFTPRQNGYINQGDRAMGGGGTTIAPTFNIAINGNADASTVEKIRAVLRDEVRQAFRGVYADAGLRFS